MHLCANVGLLNEAESLVTENIGKGWCTNAAFTSACSSKSGLQDPQLLDISGKICSKEAVCLVGDDEVKKYLGNLDLHKSLVPDVLQVHDDLQVLREQVDVITRPLLIIFDHGNWEKYSKTEEKWISLLSSRMRTTGITVQSTLPQSPAMWWSSNSQKPFPGISKTRVLKGSSTPLRGSNAWHQGD